jgi:LPXTG-motif cell wall-anchored protein
MSQPKVIGSAAAATLPLTGNGVVGMVLAGIALVVVGLLLIRSGRYRAAGNGAGTGAA